MKYLILLLVAVLACDSATEPRQLTIEIVSGANQVGGSGATLPQPIVVRVLQDGQPVPSVDVRWHAIEGGGTVSNAVTTTDAEGQASVDWTLGVDRGQQLLLATAGDGSITISASGIFQLTSITVGYQHACALSGTGEAFCWGANSTGQLGNGTETASSTPVRVNTAIRFSRITAAWSHTCGLSLAGEAYCWGDNSVGQLGVGNVTRSYTPVAVSGGDSFVDISAGFIHTCGVTTNGTARCWGVDDQGQIPSSPVSDVVQIATGEFHSCAVRSDHAAVCWGWNSTGELGSGAAFGLITDVPVQTAGPARFAKIAAGVRHTCAIATDGSVYCWGRNAAGETGVDPFIHTNVPIAMNGTHDYTAIGTGNTFTCGISAGHVFCWGSLLGNGTSASSKVPVQISSSLKFSALAVGYDQACGIANGEVWCWSPQALTPARVAFP